MSSVQLQFSSISAPAVSDSRFDVMSLSFSRHRFRSIDSSGVLCDLSLHLGGDCSLLLAIFRLLIFISVRRISDS
ncbi:hypothetical protein F2Q69_00038925 [Brassica cretica]|uniref:Uncharacterized protein n=1 Tax=Brassica cretica TaxID=69181 RepID=A0A8S9SNV7_BRACR|nr:hypothetical protein F2Q69_00038925 [Brassica cretica]